MEIKNVPVTDVPKKLATDVSTTKIINNSNAGIVSESNLRLSEAAQVTDKQLADAIEKINKFLDPARNSISFTIDKDTDITVVKVIDKTDNTVIRQMPSEEALAIARDIDKAQGVLLNTQA